MQSSAAVNQSLNSTRTNASDSNYPKPSAVREAYTNNLSREMVIDKANLIASLNSSSVSSSHNTTTTSNSSANNNHFYQNVQQLKQLQNIPQPVTVSNHVNGISSNVNNGTSNGISPLINGNTHQNGFKNPPSVLANPPNNANNSTKQRVLDGYVGFANLPNQVYRKSVKKGFEFNLMVIGESGLGKSTFINSLFLAELYSPADFPGTFQRRKKTTFVDSTTVTLSEKGVNLRLTIVDTPGFGDSIDNSNCWSPIVDYIDNKYEEYLNSESKVNRKLPISDQRIHCCLYFISPGHT